MTTIPAGLEESEDISIMVSPLASFSIKKKEGEVAIGKHNTSYLVLKPRASGEACIPGKVQLLEERAVKMQTEDRHDDMRLAYLQLFAAISTADEPTYQ